MSGVRLCDKMRYSPRVGFLSGTRFALMGTLNLGLNRTEPAVGGVVEVFFRQRDGLPSRLDLDRVLRNQTWSAFSQVLQYVWKPGATSCAVLAQRRYQPGQSSRSAFGYSPIPLSIETEALLASRPKHWYIIRFDWLWIALRVQELDEM